jgi:hypothetical protein
MAPLQLSTKNSLIELGLRLVRLGLERDGAVVSPSIALIADIDDFLVHCASQGPGYAKGPATGCSGRSSNSLPPGAPRR